MNKASKGAPKPKLASNYLIMGLQIFFGGIFTLGCGAGLLVAVFEPQSRWYWQMILTVVLLIALVASLLLLMRGVSTAMLTSRYHRIRTAMSGKNREQLWVIKKVSGKNYTYLVRDLRRMASRGYFPGAYVDLNRKEFVLWAGGSLPPLPEDNTLLREVKGKPVLPVLLVGITWLVYALLFPLYRWFDFLIVAVVSVAVFAVSARFSPARTVIVEEEKPQPKEPDPVAFDTGNADLNEVLTTAMEYMRQLQELDASIVDPALDAAVRQLLDISRQIFDYIKKTPSKVRQIRQFMNYYLPTTIKLLQNYDELSHERHKGENIHKAMSKIEDAMQSIVEVFRKELDNLYLDKALDISTDIEVMRNMMHQEGIGGDVQDILLQNKKDTEQ